MIYQRPSFRRAFDALSEPEQGDVRQAVLRVSAAFGRPHLHSGLGIRSFGRFFELRASRSLRVLFIASDGDFVLVTVGNHDQIRRFVRDNG